MHRASHFFRFLALLSPSSFSSMCEAASNRSLCDAPPVFCSSRRAAAAPPDLTHLAPHFSQRVPGPCGPGCHSVAPTFSQPVHLRVPPRAAALPTLPGCKLLRASAASVKASGDARDIRPERLTEVGLPRAAALLPPGALVARLASPPASPSTMPPASGHSLCRKFTSRQRRESSGRGPAPPRAAFSGSGVSGIAVLGSSERAISVIISLHSSVACASLL
mmetsp:Transcript_35613/g.90929  ORF Transcript_35613/g.90929 Transcript_35613/m.90929 type:complete len:220 (+) Transcript_35613:231-890(+)